MEELEGRLDASGWLPWGRLLRAHRAEAGLTLEETAAEVDPFVRTSGQSLYRLEKLREPPRGRQQRCVAAVACVIYGIHPEVMDLEMDDLPAVDERKLLTALKRLGR